MLHVAIQIDSVRPICRAILLPALEILRKVMSDSMDRFRDTLAPHWIITRLLAHLEEFVALLLEGRIPEAMEILSRHGVDHFAPDLDAYLAVLIEDRIVQLILMDAGEAVVQRSDICKAAGKAKTTEGIA